MVDARAKMLGEEEISKLLWKLAIPGIIAMLVNAVYNIVDTMFVGMLHDTAAMGAVSIAFPIFTLIAAFGQMFGVGAASYLSRLLGEKNKIEADKTASTTFFTAMASGILLTVLGLVFLEPLLKLFGATDTIMPYAKSYSEILFIGAVITVLNMTMNNMIRAEGNAKYSMIAISMGAVLNIVFDPIFMFGFGLGVRGAAIATVVAKIISFIFLLSYYLTKKSYINISYKFFTFSRKIYLEIMKIGVATFSRQALTSISLGLMNIAAGAYGDAPIAAMGISLRIAMICVLVVFGYNQGFQPIAGYNYGAKKYNRLNEAIKLSLRRTTIFVTVTSILIMIFAPQFIMGFSKDPEVISLGAKMLRVITILFPFLGFQQVYAVLFQALGKGKESFVLSISRQGIFLIPAILILPQVFGLNGVIFSQMVADFFTIVLTAFFARRIKLQERNL